MTLIISVILLMPLTVLPFYKEDIKYAWAFLVSSGISACISAIICIIESRLKIRNRGTRLSSSVILFIWVYAVVAGALPLFITGQLNVLQSLFESVSGWTTTGLSVMAAEKIPHIIVFHRCFMQYCGGIGFVLMMLAVIKGKNTADLYCAEGHNDYIKASLWKTARSIVYIYLLMLTAGVIMYKAAGMTFFDSIMHAMTALSTGGFSTKSDSIGAYKSVAVEAVTILLMILGTTNFATLLLIFSGKLRSAAKISELRFMFVILLIAVPFVSLILIFQAYMSAGEALRQGVFNVVSALSTTGFSTVSYNNWPGAAVGALILLMIIGGGTGSTAGGMKLSRVYILSRLAGKAFSDKMLPSDRIRKMFYYKAKGRSEIDTDTVRETVNFAVWYLMIFTAGSLIVTAAAHSTLENGMFEFASSLGTVGLSVGITSPTAGATVLITEMFGMILGRLEIFAVLCGISEPLIQLSSHIVKLFSRRK